jgi:ribosomal protein S18 acetylase RimI-like enzyme
VLGLSEKMCKYRVRGFEDGDETEIVRLFNGMCEGYGGFTLRTAEHWRWCCLKRPDVKKEGVFVVVDEDENVVGYAVVGSSGSIWELCYNPGRDGEEIVSLLLDEAERYLKEVGAVSVTFNAPREDRAFSNVGRVHGFAVLPSRKMFLSVLNLGELISEIVKNRKEELTGKFDEVVLVKLKDAPFWINDRVFIQISRAGVKVDHESLPSTIIVETDVISLSSLLFGILSPVQLLMRLKLKVKPFWKIPTLLRLLSSLQVKAPWFFPLSDYG